MTATVELWVEDAEPVLLETGGDGDGIDLEAGDEAPEVDLEPGDGVIVSDVYPTYEGPYLFTPGPEEQVAETRLRSVLERIVVGPIPQNYGLISWNGRIITVS